MVMSKNFSLKFVHDRILEESIGNKIIEFFLRVRLLSIISPNQDGLNKIYALSFQVNLFSLFELFQTQNNFS